MHSVYVEPSASFSTDFCARRYGISVDLQADNPLSDNYVPLQPISPTTPMSGNGMAENAAIRSPMIVLHLGTPLFIPRRIIAADTIALGALTSGGRTVTVYVELRDSATNSVQVVVDSFKVTCATDTIDRYGTIMFDPNEDQVEFPMYLTARIVADTNVTRWAVKAHLQFEGVGDTTGNGGFQKKVMRYAGRAGWVPQGDNPINLSASPNPFTNHIRIMYSVAVENSDDITEVKIFDPMGSDVSTLVHEVKRAGRWAVEFDGGALRTGMYVVAVHEKNHAQSRMMVRVR